MLKQKYIKDVTLKDSKNVVNTKKIRDVEYFTISSSLDNTYTDFSARDFMRTLRSQIASGEVSDLSTVETTLKEELIALLEVNDNNNKISLAVLQKALNGDIQAFTTIRDTIGEKPKEEVDLHNKVSYEDAIKKVSDEDEY